VIILKRGPFGGYIMEKTLTEKDLDMLRQKGLLEQNETAMMVGTQVVAENLLTRERRIIETTGLLLESKRTLLMD
jgi:hypothetical protein